MLLHGINLRRLIGKNTNKRLLCFNKFYISGGAGGYFMAVICLKNVILKLSLPTEALFGPVKPQKKPLYIVSLWDFHAIQVRPSFYLRIIAEKEFLI